MRPFCERHRRQGSPSAMDHRLRVCESLPGTKWAMKPPDQAPRDEPTKTTTTLHRNRTVPACRTEQ
ncbi:hypothetical protein O9K51_06962 [Purpureocillium lavendulum]|uniref:Uncharacterized protein n=1 Tax=Purpureocillium lavendulum TaxID=1247861 RepID=A0AB34FS34_9HYPO|nr:hypothetical protein O9K51_06962 [Purpureocillium lavendulum]